MPAPTLTSHFADTFPELSAPWQAQEAPAPTLLHLNAPLAAELGLDAEWLATDDGVRFLTGERPGPHARPVAQGYAGHQFGNYSPRLGDGRALLLGELTDPDGRLRDVHLKGSGLTPYSRPGSDGQAAVGPMLRELVVSEAMHALGIPTTRALAAVATGATVRRERLLPGAVLARVADSHLRVGTFQYASALIHQGHAPEDLLERLVRESLARHHPHRSGDPMPARALLGEVVAAQARLVAQWMAVGFVHGVMNTDNVAISGQTIDYGPCAFLDAFDPIAVFSSIDRQGRYAYGAQPQIALWNLNRFAETLLPLLGGGPESDPNAAVAAAEDALRGFAPAFDAAWQSGLSAKLGLLDDDGGAPAESAAESAADLGTRLLPLLQDARADWTAFWAGLTDGATTAATVTGSTDEVDPLARLLPGTTRPDAARQWFADWRAAGPDAALMRRTNPRRVPRNAPLQDALDAAEAGDLVPVRELLAAVAAPYTAQVPGVSAAMLTRLEQAPEDSGAFVTYCGT